MRTVTFADEEVVDFLNEKYVVVWNNHNPETEGRGVQSKYTREEMDAYPEGGGNGNLRTYIVNGDGAIVSEVQGYWSAKRFLEEARFGLELTVENAAKKHQERRAALEQQARELEQANPGELQKPIRESKVRREIAAIRLLLNGHGAPQRRDIVKTLEDVRDEMSERGVIK